MMMKKRIVSLVAAVAIIAAVVGETANVADSVVGVDAPVAVACTPTGGSVGGC
jgi:hypothetical protein